MTLQRAIAIGELSGFTGQGQYSIGIGSSSGGTSQGQYAIGIGYQAGGVSQGQYAIAIGYQAGLTGQTGSSIAINATSSTLNATGSGFYVNPIASTTNTTTFNTLLYDTTLKQISYSTTKTFVIDHPIEKEKYLVHGCLEGAESGVYYRGEAEIINDKFIIIDLPNYTKIFKNFTIQITPYIDFFSEDIIYNNYITTNIVNNSFKVFGKNGKFYWIAHGKRDDINIEPNKKDVNVKGRGPYLWI